MKKILIVISALLLVLVIGLIIMVKSADTETYLYFETIVVKDTAGVVVDTVHYMYPIYADNEKEGYMKAYEMYFANSDYLKAIESRSNVNGTSYQQLDFKITNTDEVKLKMTRSIDREITLISIGEIYKHNITSSYWNRKNRIK